MSLPTGIYLKRDAWRLADVSAEVGQGRSGRVTRVAQPAPVWTARLTLRVPSVTTAWLAWEAWIEARQGRVVADSIRPHNSRTGSGGSTEAIFFDGGVSFDGGYGFDGYTAVKVDIGAAQFATALTLDQTPPWTVGQFVWINDVMHRVTAISGAQIEMQPPLRAAVDAGDAVSGSGTISMRLASDDGGGHERDVAGFADVTVELIEDL